MALDFTGWGRCSDSVTGHVYNLDWSLDGMRGKLPLPYFEALRQAASEKLTLPIGWRAGDPSTSNHDIFDRNWDAIAQWCQRGNCYTAAKDIAIYHGSGQGSDTYTPLRAFERAIFVQIDYMCDWLIDQEDPMPEDTDSDFTMWTWVSLVARANALAGYSQPAAPATAASLQGTSMGGDGFDVCKWLYWYKKFLDLIFSTTAGYSLDLQHMRIETTEKIYDPGVGYTINRWNGTTCAFSSEIVWQGGRSFLDSPTGLEVGAREVIGEKYIRGMGWYPTTVEASHWCTESEETIDAPWYPNTLAKNYSKRGAIVKASNSLWVGTGRGKWNLWICYGGFGGTSIYSGPGAAGTNAHLADAWCSETGDTVYNYAMPDAPSTGNFIAHGTAGETYPWLGWKGDFKVFAEWELKFRS